MCVVLSSGLRRNSYIPAGRERSAAVRSDDCFVPYTTEYGFCKPFDRDVAEVQVELRAIKVEENHSVSFYGTIRYVMRL